MKDTKLKYSPECMAMLEKMKVHGTEKHHLLISQPQYNGDRCMDFIEDIARVYYEGSGIRRCFSKCFVYSKLPIDCNEKKLFNIPEKPRIVCEHYNPFKGVCCYDISEYLDCPDMPAFRIMIDYVKQNSSDIMFIFVASSNDKSAIDSIYSKIKKQLLPISVESINIGYETEDTYSSFAAEENRKIGFRM